MPKKIILAVSMMSLFKLLGIPGDVVLAQSRSECEEYARNYAKRNSSGRGTTLRGTATGAFGGAVIGGIFGDAALGAGLGALGGTVAGSSRKSKDYQNLYNIAYDDCRSGRVRPR
ncbi:MAG: glycine zipper family protein [Xenococcaceae cyanobacterium MO_167.B52]|nr:glycine zipper family protein [Xenococcaceae cyanobacterium MO_167.B52]